MVLGGRGHNPWAQFFSLPPERPMGQRLGEATVHSLLHTCGMFAGLEIRRVLSRTGRGWRRKALVLGLADTKRPDSQDSAAAAPTAAGVWAGRPRGSPAVHAGGQAGEDQPGVVRQAEVVPRGEGGTAAELLGVGAHASLCRERL